MAYMYINPSQVWESFYSLNKVKKYELVGASDLQDKKIEKKQTVLYDVVVNCISMINEMIGPVPKIVKFIQ